MATLDPAQMEALKQAVAQQLQADVVLPQTLALDVGIFWRLYGTALVFLMQCGFALLEAGSVRAKNTKNILLKNILDACIGSMLWWAFGHSFAYGKGNSFFGWDHFFLEGVDDIKEPTFWANWIFQWAFAATSATIVSGAVAERCRLIAYFVYTTVLTTIVYPVGVHWAWSKEGWLSPFRSDDRLFDCGLHDFAGAGVVHMTGGAAAFMGAYFLGPRLRRFAPDGKPLPIQGHSTVLAAIGTLMLWFGWYGFNPVSADLVGNSVLCSKVAVTTTISAASGAAATLLYSTASTGILDLPDTMNGILAGLVSISGPAATVHPYAAFVIGILGGSMYLFMSKMLLRFRIDDPLDASSVHFGCGLLGILSTGIFANERGSKLLYGLDDCHGLLYGGTKVIAAQVVGALALASWSLGLSGAMFYAMARMQLLRVPSTEEEVGLDHSHHGGSAYDFTEKGAAPGILLPESADAHGSYAKLSAAAVAPAPPLAPEAPA